MALMERVTRRLHNAFTPEEPTQLEQDEFYQPETHYGAAYSVRPDRQRFQISNDRTIVTSIYTRIAVDAASVHIKHVRLDDQDRYLQDIESGLNNCLNVEANIDQAGRQFRQDIFMTLCTKGIAAIVPVDTTVNPKEFGSYDIVTLRVGDIVQWYPKHVKVSVYNENKGLREEIVLPKKLVAIVENPLYSVMNETSSTLQRLTRKLALLDTVDEASASGKLDLIIQLPYVIKSDARKQQAEQRREDIEFQLKGSKYGIAYTDGTEKITQLNRPVENGMLTQVQYLTEKLYGELGITKAVMDGTAGEAEMLNYLNRTVEPMIDAVVEAMARVFLTKTARSQKQSITYFRDAFKLVPMKELAELADKLTRNEIVSSNEIRQAIGLRPSSDPKADQLVNSNMPQGTIVASPDDIEGEVVPDEEEIENEAEEAANAEFDPLDNEADSIMAEIEALGKGAS